MATTATKAISTSAAKNFLVDTSPIFTANVLFPACVSPGISRKLLMTNSAHAIAPTATDATRPVTENFSAMTNSVPIVATTPKNKKTNTSPKPAYPYGRGPPVYVHAATIAATPTASSHNVVARARIKPATAATPKHRNAARFTDAAVASPDPTKRNGPTRSLSVPRTPSE